MPNILSTRKPRREIYVGIDPLMKEDLEKNILAQQLLVSLKEQKAELDEIMRSIEDRDITTSQVKEHLKSVQKNMKEVRRASKFWISKPPSNSK